MYLPPELLLENVFLRISLIPGFAWLANLLLQSAVVRYTPEARVTVLSQKDLEHLSCETVVASS